MKMFAFLAVALATAFLIMPEAAMAATGAMAHGADPIAYTAMSAILAVSPSIETPRVRGIRAIRNEGDLNKVLAELNRGFETFKAEQEAQMAALKKGVDDVVSAEKIERINNDISNLTNLVEEAKAAIDAARIGGAGNGPSAEARAHAEAYQAWMRRGTDPANGMRVLEVGAALTTDSDPDGGYLVPAAVEADIERVLGAESAMRAIANVVIVGAGGWEKPVNFGGATSGWVGERDTRPETGTPQLGVLGLSWGEIYANPAVTQRMLDDGIFDVEAWLADEVGIEFAEEEGASFITGNGTNKPRGFLSYTNVANSSYEWGKLGYIASGAAANFATPTTSVSPADAFVDLYHSLKSGYRNGASWLMNDLTVGSIRKFKAADGAWLWAPPTSEAPPTILGKPLYTDDNMPTVAADAFAVAFGNFKRGYTIGDRFGTRTLRDPYTNKPFVHFYSTKRVGGAVTNFAAIKLMKIATS
jgi:HK97 family phage major capsid protein